MPVHKYLQWRRIVIQECLQRFQEEISGCAIQFTQYPGQQIGHLKMLSNACCALNCDTFSLLRDRCFVIVDELALRFVVDYMESSRNATGVVGYVYNWLLGVQFNDDTAYKDFGVESQGVVYSSGVSVYLDTMGCFFTERDSNSIGLDKAIHEYRESLGGFKLDLGQYDKTWGRL